MWKRKRHDDACDIVDDDDLHQRKAKMMRVEDGDDDLDDGADTSTPPGVVLVDDDTQHRPKLGSESDQLYHLTQPKEATTPLQFQGDSAPLQCPSDQDDDVQDQCMVSDNRRSVGLCDSVKSNPNGNPIVSVDELERLLDTIQLK